MEQKLETLGRVRKSCSKIILLLEQKLEQTNISGTERGKLMKDIKINKNRTYSMMVCGLYEDIEDDVSKSLDALLDYEDTEGVVIHDIQMSVSTIGSESFPIVSIFYSFNKSKEC
ncbi:hypothetical protein CD114_10920 [Mammaliicoccus sciuri]|nr:hypothetical protein CD114_10920 [Mammaliicoccus sciuri]